MSKDNYHTDPLARYFRLEEAATFFLYSAFHHAYLAAQLEVAGLIFGERIMSIDPEPDWVVPQLPTTLPELLHALPDKDVISDATAAKLAQAWDNAQMAAPSSGRKLSRTHAIESIEIVGHVINLSACVESVINRHLFLMRESGKLENHIYLGLDRTEVLPKILFAFRDEVMSKELQTDRLTRLFRLRNQAVHFKESSASSIQPTIEELLGIWNQVEQLFKFIEGEPAPQQISDLVNEVMDKWFA